VDGGAAAVAELAAAVAEAAVRAGCAAVVGAAEGVEGDGGPREDWGGLEGCRWEGVSWVL